MPFGRRAIMPVDCPVKRRAALAHPTGYGLAVSIHTFIKPFSLTLDLTVYDNTSADSHVNVFLCEFARYGTKYVIRLPEPVVFPPNTPSRPNPNRLHCTTGCWSLLLRQKGIRWKIPPRPRPNRHLTMQNPTTGEVLWLDLPPV